MTPSVSRGHGLAPALDMGMVDTGHSHSGGHLDRPGNNGRKGLGKNRRSFWGSPRPRVRVAGTASVERQGHDGTKRLEQRPLFSLKNRGDTDWTNGRMIIRAVNGESWMNVAWHMRLEHDKHGSTDAELVIGVPPGMVEGVYQRMARDWTKGEETDSKYRASLELPAGDPPLRFAFPVAFGSGVAPNGASFWLWIHLWRGTNRRFLFRVNAKKATACRVRLWNPWSWGARRKMRVMDR